MKLMQEAPRDGTIIIAWHKTTREPLAVCVHKGDGANRTVFDWRNMWRYFAAKPGSTVMTGYVAESNLMGWQPLPKATE